MGRTQVRGEDLEKSAAVKAFFARLDDVDEIALLSMAAARDAIPPQEIEDAWTEVRAVAATSGVAASLERVRQKAIERAERFGHTYLDLVAYSGLQPTRSDVRRGAAPAIVDAAVAVALGDRLSEKARDALLGPWLGVTPESE